MKRKITSIISVGTALVLSLFLFACDENEQRPAPPAPDPTPVPVVLTPREKLERGVTLLAEEENLSGSVSAARASDVEGKIEYNYTYAKRGDKVKVSESDGEYLLDLQTGYGYYPTDDGTAFSQFVPAGWYGYAADAFETEFSDKISGGGFDEYMTETDGEVKLSFDMKSDVNKYLEMLGDYYDGSLYDIANETVSSSGMIIDEQLDAIVKTIIASRDLNANFLIAAIDAQLKIYGFDVTFKQIFIKAGVTEEQYAAVGKRKVGEMVAGALPLLDKLSDFVTDYIAGDADLATFDYETALRDAFDAMFVDEITEEQAESLEEDLNATKAKLISMLKTAKVKAIVDMLADKTGIDDIREMAANAVTFTKLKAEFTVRFDESGRITTVGYSASVAHNYTPATVADETETEGGEQTPDKIPSLLDDNNYSFVGSVTFDTSDSSEISLPEDLTGLGDEVSVSAVAGTGETVVYIETGSEQNSEWQFGGATLYDSDKTLASDKAVFAVRDGELVFASELIESVRPRTGVARLVFTGDLNGKPYEITLYVPCDYSLQSILACGAARNV